jgi:hypothetical protein
MGLMTAAQVGASSPARSFYGSFALTVGTHYNADTPDGEDTEVYLEHCGMHLHRLVLKAGIPVPEENVLPAANTREVVWMPATVRQRRFLSALTLPGLRRFTIRLPKRLTGSACAPPWYTECVSQIALTDHRLYLLTAQSDNPPQLWVTPSPLPPKRPHT